MAGYMIHGFCFRAQKPIQSQSGDGADFYRANTFFRVMFAGFIFPKLVAGKSVFAGTLEDCFGKSTLTECIIEPETLQFINNRGNGLKIKFMFWPQNGIWVGEYFEPSIGRGKAHCILTEVPEEFFKPD